jgi:hypothetical protein
VCLVQDPNSNTATVACSGGDLEKDDSQTEVAETVSSKSAANSINTGVFPATSFVEISSSNDCSLTPRSTPRSSRKMSILTHTNPDLLNTLNKMFTSPNAVSSNTRSRTPNRRASVAVTGSATSNNNNNSLSQQSSEANGSTVSEKLPPKEMKKSKSKLLKVT